jgi:hypothetical protein
MRYRIFPAIGIARLGEDDNFFLGPERPGAGPGDLQADGTFKDWIRGAASHRLLVERSGRFGLVVQQGADEVFLEVERDPAL